METTFLKVVLPYPEAELIRFHNKVRLNRTEFVALIEAAADFDDFIANRYFELPNSEQNAELSELLQELQAKNLADGLAADVNALKGQLASVKIGALKLRDSRKLPPWARRVRQMLNACGQKHDSRPGSLSKRLLAPILADARTELQSRMQRQSSCLPACALLRLERQLESRLTKTIQYCLNYTLTAFEAAFRGVYIQRGQLRREEIECEFFGEDVGDRLVRILQTYPALAKLWSQLIVNWVDKICEFSERFATDRSAIERVFYAARRIGDITDISIDLSDPHHGGRETMIVQLQGGRVVYKPRSGRHETDWFSFLHGINRQGFIPKFRIVRLLRRREYCWMEFVEHRACHTEMEAHFYFRRAGGLLCAAYLLGAIDCHRDNLIAAGDQPVLIDLETLFHDAAPVDGQKAESSLMRTGLLHVPVSLSGAVGDISGFGGTFGGQFPTLKEKYSIYAEEIERGFGDMWKLIGQPSTRRGKAFERTAQRLVRKPWRRIYRSTRTYSDVRERSLAPESLRSGLERSRKIALNLLGPGHSSGVILDEINALGRFDIPYFSHVPGNYSQRAKCVRLPELLVSLRAPLSAF